MATSKNVHAQKKLVMAGNFSPELRARLESGDDFPRIPMVKRGGGKIPK
jgi:hypothetical protein